MTSSPPASIPPSAGGTGLATVSGLLTGWNAAALWSGRAVALTDWVPGLILLVLVVALLGGMHLLRRRMGVQITPESLRRQWMIVAAGWVVGLVGGAWLVGPLG